MYQVVVAGPPRLNVGAFPSKDKAVDHALAMPDQSFFYEVVDDRTALLKAIITDHSVQYILKPTRRDIA